jgi:hypothetical protein
MQHCNLYGANQMKRLPVVRVVSLVVGAVALWSTALGHHSGAMFDRTKTLSIVGVIKEWRFANPHAWLQVYAPYNGQENVVWGFESTATQILLNQGFRRTSFHIGDKVTIVYNPLRDGAAGGVLVSVTLPDGTVLPRKTGQVSAPSSGAVYESRGDAAK